MDEMFWKMKKVSDNRKSDQAETSDIIKKQLMEIVRKRMKIVFAGALDEFEKAFGDLWDSDQLLEDKWKYVRNKILDNGNNQSRILQEEIDQYDIVGWNRYNYHGTMK